MAATFDPMEALLMLKRRWSILLVVLAVGALLAPAGFAQAPIKIGVIQPLSGAVAASGNYVRMGAEIARDWANTRGGVNGRKIELIIEDNKSDPKEAASAAEKLIVRDKVPAIMGAWGSSTSTRIPTPGTATSACPTTTAAPSGAPRRKASSTGHAPSRWASAGRSTGPTISTSRPRRGSR